MFDFLKKKKLGAERRNAPSNDNEMITVHSLYNDGRKKSINYNKAETIYYATISVLRRNSRFRKKYPDVLPLLDLGLTLLIADAPKTILQDADNPGLYCCPSCFKYIEPHVTRCLNCGARVKRR